MMLKGVSWTIESECARWKGSLTLDDDGKDGGGKGWWGKDGGERDGGRMVMFVGREGKHARDVYPYYVSSLKKGGWGKWVAGKCVRGVVGQGM